MNGRKKNYRYSRQFKETVLTEVSKSNERIADIAKMFNISQSVLYRWMKQHKIPTPIHEVIYVDMAKKQSLEDQIKELKRENAKLKETLVSETIERVKYQALYMVAEEETGIDFKKKDGTKQS